MLSIEVNDALKAVEDALKNRPWIFKTSHEHFMGPGGRHLNIYIAHRKNIDLDIFITQAYAGERYSEGMSISYYSTEHNAIRHYNFATVQEGMSFLDSLPAPVCPTCGHQCDFS